MQHINKPANAATAMVRYGTVRRCLRHTLTSGELHCWNFNFCSRQNQGRHIRQAIFFQVVHVHRLSGKIRPSFASLRLSPTTYDIVQNNQSVQQLVSRRLSLRPGYFVVPVRVLHTAPLDNIMRVLVIERFIIQSDFVSYIALIFAQLYRVWDRFDPTLLISHSQPPGMWESQISKRQSSCDSYCEMPPTGN